MGRDPTNRPFRWGVRWPVHTDQVGVQHSPTPTPIFRPAAGRINARTWKKRGSGPSLFGFSFSFHFCRFFFWFWYRFSFFPSIPWFHRFSLFLFFPFLLFYFSVSSIFQIWVNFKFEHFLDSSFFKIRANSKFDHF
jgi:hypothetical protein